MAQQRTSISIAIPKAVPKAPGLAVGRLKSQVGRITSAVRVTGGRAVAAVKGFGSGDEAEPMDDEAAQNFTAQADHAYIPEDDVPFSVTRSACLARQQSGLTIPNYDAVPELEEARRNSIQEAAADSPQLQGRGSMLDIIKDTLFGRGSQENLAAAESQQQQELEARRSKKKSVQEQNNAEKPHHALQKLMDDPRLGAGEAAFIIHYNAIKASNAGPMQRRMVGGKQVSPISRNYNMIRDRVELEDDDGDIGAAHSGPTPHLTEWFEAGLHKVGGEGVEGTRDLPVGYEVASWSTPGVPLIRHKQSGVVTWPVRLDLTPLFAQVEKHKAGFQVTRTTVYHYTSAGGFERLIAPPTHYDDEEDYGDEEKDYADEIWSRLDEDLHLHGVPLAEGAPDLSLQFLSSEPARFDSRESIGRAVHWTSRPRFAPSKVGCCVALQVPTDYCLGIPGKQYVHTVIVLPPSWADQKDSDGEDGKGKLGNFVSLAAQQNTDKKKKQGNVATALKSMNLLDGLVDRVSGKVIPPPEAAASSGARNRPRQLSTDSQPGLETLKEVDEEAEPEDEELVRIRTRLDNLRKEKVVLERKIKHAMKSKEKLDNGQDVKFLATDDHRLESLHRRLSKCTLQLQTSERDLELYLENQEESDDSVVSSLSSKERSEHSDDDLMGIGLFDTEDEVAARKAAAQKAKEAAEARRAAKEAKKAEENKSMATKRLAAMRKRHQRGKQQGGLTYFSNAVNNNVQDMEEEYDNLSGDLFREVFGGNIQGVKAWLENEDHEINKCHASIGWSPLHMAVSAGDSRMVTLLITHSADVSQATANEGWCPVHFAVWKNSVELIRIILKADDGSVKYKTTEGETALYMSVRASSARIRDEMVRELLKAHADPNAKQKDDWTPLSLAVVRNYASEVKQMIQNRGNVFDECPDEPGKTIWQASARHAGLQDLIKSKLNSRDLHVVEKRWPGTLTKKPAPAK